MSEAFRLDMSEAEQTLMFWEVPNELINGFRLADFDQHVGISEAVYIELSKELRRNPAKRQQLNRAEGAILRNALKAVLQELGEDEFQIRTGIDYLDGHELLRRFDDSLQASTQAENKGTRWEA